MSSKNGNAPPPRPDEAPVADGVSPNSMRKQGKPGALMLRGSVLQIVAFACNLLSSFFIMPLLIHSLGERGYGLWALIGTIVGQLGLFDVGLMTTTERFMANTIARNDQEAGNSIYSTSISIFVVVGAVVFFVIAMLSLATPLWLHDSYELHEFELAILISGLNLAWLFPFSVMQGALAAAFRSDVVTIAQVTATIVRTGLTVAVVFLGYGLIGLALGVFAASVVERSLLGLMMRRHLPGIGFHRSSVRWKTLKELIAFSKYVFVVKVTDAARYRIHNLLIAALAGIAAVTHYSVAIRLTDYFEALVLRVSSVSQPVYSMHFTRGEDEKLREKFLTISRFGSVVCCIFAATAIVFGRSFLRLWLGHGFHDSYYALSILIVAMFFALLQSPSRDVLRVIYKHQFDAKLNGIEVIINLILTVILVPYFGIIGAAIGTAIPMIVVKAMILPAYVCRTIGLSLWTYYRAVGQPLLLALLLSAPVSILVPLRAMNSMLELMGVAGGFAIVLTLILIYTLPTDDKITLVYAYGRKRIEALPGGETFLRSLGVV